MDVNEDDKPYNPFSHNDLSIPALIIVLVLILSSFIESLSSTAARETHGLITVTSASQCKVSLWGFPYVCLCPCML